MEIKKVPINRIKLADWNPKYNSEYLKEKLKQSIPKEIRLTPRIEIEKEEDIEISPTHFVAIELDGELAEWVAKKADEDNIPIAEEVLKIVRNKISTD